MVVPAEVGLPIVMILPSQLFDPIPLPSPEDRRPAPFETDVLLLHNPACPSVPSASNASDFGLTSSAQSSMLGWLSL